jgi:hypothetical protein
MDYRLFAPGTVAWFPVSVPGALFYLGDGHACQGDGEIVGTGIETSFEMQVTFQVLKRRITWPRGETAEDIFTIGNARPLDQASSGGIYPAMLLLGAGSAISMVISVSLESDLIGANTESGAFVYGACSFADKLGNGVSIVALQLAGSGLADRSEAKGAFFRVVNGLVPMAAIAAATLVCWTISFPKHLRSHAQQLREADAPTVCA